MEFGNLMKVDSQAESGSNDDKHVEDNMIVAGQPDNIVVVGIEVASTAVVDKKKLCCDGQKY